MSISARATKVTFDTDDMTIVLSDGRKLSVPLAWFPRLLAAKPHQLDQVEITRSGFHWDELDEDISLAGLLEGRGDTREERRTASAISYEGIDLLGLGRTFDYCVALACKNAGDLNFLSSSVCEHVLTAPDYGMTYVPLLPTRHNHTHSGKHYLYVPSAKPNHGWINIASSQNLTTMTPAYFIKLKAR